MPKSHSKQFSLYNSGLVLSSVEQLPNNSASVAFTVDSGKVFREDGEIIADSSDDNHLPVRNEKGPSRYDLVHYILGD